MTVSSSVPAVIDYLVAQCQASALLGASATAPVTVTDGPSTTTDTLTESLHLWIGWDQVTNAGAGMEAVQKWPYSDHARTRDEDGTIVCTADAWGTGTTAQAARNACYSIIYGLDLLLRGDPAAGGPGDASMGGLVMWSAVDGPFEWFPRQDQSGPGCACVFHVTYHSRLLVS
jgi:hypothetical protein